MLFSYYDRSGDGRIDYREFTQIFIDGGKTSEDLEEEQTAKQMRSLNRPKTE
jgi:Ca2+-binding EF-hand superfamily protein